MAHPKSPPPMLYRVNVDPTSPARDVSVRQPWPCAGGYGATIDDGTHCIGCADLTDNGEPLTFYGDTTALVPWYGSNRMLADAAGEAMGDGDVCFIPFAGSLTEVRRIRARQIVAADLHEDLINLAKVVRDPVTGPRLQTELQSAVFHPTELREAQERLRSARLEGGLFAGPRTYETDLARARDYFVACWMGRSADAGTDNELRGSLSVRYTGSGGGSVVRYQSAVDALCPAWADAFRRCEFVVEDYRVFLGRVRATMNRQRAEAAEAAHNWLGPKKPGPKTKGSAGHVDRVIIYCDPPFPDAGDGYRFKFTPAMHRTLFGLVDELSELGARVVMRYYDHPLIRELYDQARWEWVRPKGGRDQNNNEKPEVLICRGGVR